MKVLNKFKSLLAVLLLGVLLSGCRDSTQYGECIGLVNDKKPELVYEVSTRNVVMAVIFSETLMMPILVGAFYLYCPVGYQKVAK